MTERVLSDLEKQVLAMKIAQPGLTNSEIAARVGKTRQWISTLVNRDDVRRVIDDALEDAVEAARHALIAGSVKAANKLVALIDEGETDHVKRLAARDVILILQKRGDDDAVGDEVWETGVAKSGAVTNRRVPRHELADGYAEETGDDEHVP